MKSTGVSRKLGLVTALGTSMVTTGWSQGLVLKSVETGTMLSGPNPGDPSLNILVGGGSAIQGTPVYSLSTNLWWVGGYLNYSVSSLMAFVPGRDELVQIPLALIAPLQNGVFPADTNGTLTFSVSGMSATTGYSINSNIQILVLTELPSQAPSTIRSRERYTVSGAARSITPYPFSVRLVSRDTGQPVRGAFVTFSAATESAGSGHNHFIRANSWLNDISGPLVDDANVDLNLPAGYRDPGGSYDFYQSVVTDQNGLASIRIVPSEMAYSERITVSYGRYAITRGWSIRGASGLYPVSATSNYNLIGATDDHPSGTAHYATLGCLSKIVSFGNRFRSLQQPVTSGGDSELAQIRSDLSAAGYVFGSIRNSQIRSGPRPFDLNDLSLRYGGMFDINGDCSPPHGGHRDGRNADIRTKFFIINPMLSESQATATTIEIPDSNGEQDSFPTSASVRALTGRYNARLAELLFNAARTAGFTVLKEDDHWHLTSPN